MNEIKQITQEQALKLLESCDEYGRNYTPLGIFWHMTELDDKTIYVGIDNSTGEAWIEDFNEVDKCLAWLRGEYELDEKGEMI